MTSNKVTLTRQKLNYLKLSWPTPVELELKHPYFSPKIV